MPALHALDYAVLRLVPHVERQEFLNVGVLLYCRGLHFLDCRIELDLARLTAFAPDFDPEPAAAQLELVVRLCAGDPTAGALSGLPQAERFRWLAAPRSTVLQVSPVHRGLCADARQALDDLYRRLVAYPPMGSS